MFYTQEFLPRNNFDLLFYTNLSNLKINENLSWLNIMLSNSETKTSQPSSGFKNEPSVMILDFKISVR